MSDIVHRALNRHRSIRELPIHEHGQDSRFHVEEIAVRNHQIGELPALNTAEILRAAEKLRSEERRVGKECRL